MPATATDTTDESVRESPDEDGSTSMENLAVLTISIVSASVLLVLFMAGLILFVYLMKKWTPPKYVLKEGRTSAPSSRRNSRAPEQVQEREEPLSESSGEDSRAEIASNAEPDYLTYTL